MTIIRFAQFAFLGAMFSEATSAQGFEQGLPTAPSGFSRPVQTSDSFDNVGELLDDFRYVASISAFYDSNVTQGSDGGRRPEEDAFIIGLGGNVEYRGSGTDWTYGASYGLNYDQYFGDRSDLSGLNQQSVRAFLVYSRGKIVLGSKIGLSVNEGANRFYSEVIKQTSFTYGFDVSYAISPKTSVVGSLSQSFLESNNERTADTSYLDANVAALWKLSALTQLGPGLRYTFRTGENQQDRQSLGPSVNLKYRLSAKVSLSSRVGLDFVDYSGGQSADPSVSASIGLNYRASALWGLNASLYRDTQADPTTPGTYNQITSTRIGYYRNIRRATLNLGAGYEFNESESDGTASTSRRDRQYLTLDSSLSMPILSQRVLASVFLKYRNQASSAEIDDFDAFQSGIALTSQF